MATDLVTRSSSRSVGYLLYLGAATLFAVNGTNIVAILETGFAPERLSQFRITAAFVVLLAVVAATRPAALRLRRAEVPWLLLFGIAGVAMTQYFYFLALERLPVGVALVIEFTAPFMVALWVRFAMKQPVNSRVWLAMVIALVGLSMVAQAWLGFAVNVVGIAAAFGAAAALAIYYLIGERQVSQPQPRDNVSLTMWSFGAGSLFWIVVQPPWLFPWGSLMATGYPLGSSGPGVPVWALACWMVVMGTVLPFMLAVSSLRHITASQASAVGMVEPIIAAAVAWIALGQVLAPVQIIGGLVVLLGVSMAERAR